jgi:hypothetical protein
MSEGSKTVKSVRDEQKRGERGIERLLQVPESDHMFYQSVSQCILGNKLSCIFTEQRRHYSTLPGPEKLVFYHN